MRILLFSITFFLLFTQSYAATSYIPTSANTNCNEYPSITTSPGKKYIPNSTSTSSPSSGSFNCTMHGYYSGTWSAFLFKGSHYSCPNNRYASQIQEVGTRYRIFCMLLDDTPPSLSDIGDTIPANNTNFLATAIKSITINVSSSSGSSVNFLEGYFENRRTVNSFGPKITINSNTLSANFDIRNVDKSRASNGSRQYSYKITKLCDEAGNCLTSPNPLKTFTYNVYANTTSIPTKRVINNELTSISNIADGTSKKLRIELKDTYGNKIVAASGINRKVNFKFNTNNFLYLNQYNIGGSSSVSAGNIIFPIGNNLTTNFNNYSSTNGNYDFNFNVYSPTYNSYSKANPSSRFDINNVKVDITSNFSSSSLVNPSNILIDNSSNIHFRFKPIYTTAISGKIRDDGFIEGATQNSSLSISKNGTKPVSGGGVYLEFGSGANNLVNNKFNIENNSIKVEEGHKTSYNSLTNIGSLSSSKTLLTRLNQELGTTVDNLQKSYLASIIKYSIDGKTVVYPSDIIGKNNYFGALDVKKNTIQTGLKVLGLTSSQQYNEIISGQKGTDIVLLGKLGKPELKKNIRKNAFNLIKNVNLDNGSNKITDITGAPWNNSDGKKLLGDNVLYFGNLAGANVELGTGVGDETVGGKKTIIVEGGNLYIKSNMIYAHPSSILGIIVLKDSNGNGGNVYIDTSVTKIVGTIFADKAIISYNGSELDGNTNASVLKNQLHIYGSIFSENTIGGSRKNPLQCPYYVSSCIDLAFTQKFDLNFLRRYFLIDDGFGSLIPANSGASVFPPSSNYHKYPTVIEYNSFLQISPPPLFLVIANKNL